MKNQLIYLLILPLFIALTSCSGKMDEDIQVPEGVLRIFSDKESVVADGKDVVTFKVMFGSKDVTNESTCRLVREYDGNKKYMAYGADAFSTVTPGKYTFTASYYNAGNHDSDNFLVIDAEEFFSGEQRQYLQRVLALNFTSTECTSCPAVAKSLVSLSDANPGKISIASIHTYMTAFDPMEIEESRTYVREFSVSALPRIFWNMRKGTNLMGPDFKESYLAEIASYVPSCGVSVATAFKSSSEIEIEVGITSNYPMSYRYLVFLVEDGIDKYGQMDNTSSSYYYIHNNVVRDVLSTNVYGDKINEGLPLTTGVEVKARKAATISSDWNTDNMRVIVAALTSSDGGYTYVVDNVSECKVGESVSYQYSE